MHVRLAGYNIDSSLIAKLNDPAATPEVISAAYARISRSEKSITELHAKALNEVAKARESNQSIIFDMGHSSVAEHAVFNLDLIDVSRLMVDSVETIRLASFTEKSQRYVTFKDDYVIPAELDKPRRQRHRQEYIALMDDLFKEYKRAYRFLLQMYAEDYPELSKRELEGKAKEDARYILPLATKTQVGMTINARSLENLLQRLADNPLAEARELFQKIYEPVFELCPSLIRYPGKRDYNGTFDAKGMRLGIDGFNVIRESELVSYLPKGDDLILAVLLFEQTQADLEQCRGFIARLSKPEKEALWSQVFAGLKPWHKLPRAFELVDYTFELQMSESCWAQFKRHRFATLIRQRNPYTEDERFLLYLPMDERYDIWKSLVERASDLRKSLAKLEPGLAGYARLNLSKVKVIAKMNLRELYHFVRLRSDEHAQWEIRYLSQHLVEYLRQHSPHAAAFLCGKSEFPQKD